VVTGETCEHLLLARVANSRAVEMLAESHTGYFGI
jgi:hypothetical protein